MLPMRPTLRHRIEQALFAWALWAAAFCQGRSLRGQSEQQNPKMINFEFDSITTVDQLNKLADTATTEHLRCLMGGPTRGWWELITAGDNPTVRNQISVDLLHTPTIILQTPHRIGHLGCPAGTVGIWHNHLTTEMIEMGPGGVWITGARIPPTRRCFLSEIDIYGDTSLRGNTKQERGNIVFRDRAGTWQLRNDAALLYVVQTDARHRCWWLATQVLEAMRQEPTTTRIYPPENQRTW